MSFPNTKITVAANLWIRQMEFVKNGDANEGHVHNFDHLTLLASGSVNVHVDGNVTKFTAPQMIFIKQGKSHFIEALEDNTIAYCVHALRNKESEESEILDADQIPKGAEIFDYAKPL